MTKGTAFAKKGPHSILVYELRHFDTTAGCVFVVFVMAKSERKRKRKHIRIPYQLHLSVNCLW